MKSGPLKILSLGAGVQSSTVFLMSCYGEIERVSYAIFADTGYESRQVYEWLDFLKAEGVRCGVPVHVVKNRDLKTDALNGQVRGLKKDGVRWASLPYFTVDRVTGERGMIRRQCTDEYKIRPVKYKIREILGKGRRERIAVGAVELWKGISIDEASRATVSDVKWQTHYYPLIELGMTRFGCLSWFEGRGLPRPPRSSCLCCPYHSDDEWRRIKNESPDEWADVVAFDKAIRKCGGMRGDVFLHEDRIPLDEVDLRTAEEAGQLRLFEAPGFAHECAGMCGV